MTQREALQKYPRLIAHMICESLGYFTPGCAANAVARYIDGETFACEWYSHMCGCRGKGYFDREELAKVGKDVITSSFTRRRSHKGYMASYAQALSLVKAELEREGCTSNMLASWF